MGYYTRHEGRITITPPLNHAEISASPTSLDINLVLTEDATETDTSVTRVITAAALEVAEGDIKGYTVQEDIQDLVAAHPAHEFTGYIDCIAEEGERWRYVMQGCDVVRVEPRVVWPEDEGEPFDFAAAAVIVDRMVNVLCSVHYDECADDGIALVARLRAAAQAGPVTP